MNRQLRFLPFFLLASHASAQTAPLCDNFARSEAQQVISIFHDPKKNEDEKRISLSALFQEAVDSDWIGRYVLGPVFRNSTPEQQREYLATYRRYISQIYVSRFDNDLADDIQDIKVTGVVQDGPHRFNAAMKIERHSGEPVSTTLLLDDSDGRCRVHDVTVEGVSLLISGRSEFASLASAKGIAGVTDGIKRRLAPQP